MPGAPISIGVSEFKAKCLRLLEETRQYGREWVITKKSKILARVIPAQRSTATRRGSRKGMGKLRGNIAEWSCPEAWDADQ